MAWLTRWRARTHRPEPAPPAPPAPAPVAAPAPAPVVEDDAPIRYDGAVVADVDVSHLYPGAIRQTLLCYDWTRGEVPDRTPVTVFPVRDAIVTRCYMVIDPARNWLFQNQTYRDIGALFPTGDLLRPDGFRFRSHALKPVEGRVVVIGGPIDNNYYHWLLNWLMRLELFRQVAPELHDAPDVRFLIDVRARYEPFASCLAILGIDPDRIVWADHLEDHRLDQAILVTLPDQNSYYPCLLRGLTDRLRAGCGIAARGGTRRIWIDRQRLEAPKRRVHNMDEIVPVLDRFGFERLTLEDMPLDEQIAALSQAEVVVGVHGAGLANMIFCQPRARVLLIEKDYNLAMGLSRMFAVLATACGLRNELLIAGVHAVEGTVYDRLFTLHHQDVVIDPAALAAALEGLCGRGRDL